MEVYVVVINVHIQIPWYFLILVKNNKTRTLFEWDFINPTYKEVRHVAAYDGMVLFAALGGYSGMLLGLSFFQIPALLKSAYEFIRHCYQDVDETKEKDCVIGK